MMSNVEKVTTSDTCVQNAGTPNFAPSATGSSSSDSLITYRYNPLTDDGEMYLEETDDMLVRWYPLRIRYSNAQRAITVRDEFRRNHVQTYLHMRQVEVDENDELKQKMVPATNRLLFVLAKKGRIKKLKRENSVCSLAQFISKNPLDGTHRQIITVPDRQMQNFIAAETLPDPYSQRVPLTYTDFLDKKGREVRIIRGPFRGVQGEIKRIQGRRIVVALLRDVREAVGIANILPSDMELL